VNASIADESQFNNTEKVLDQKIERIIAEMKLN